MSIGFGELVFLARIDSTQVALEQSRAARRS
jgi:hypothetical protein